MNAVTMQMIIKKLLLGIQFPMLDLPRKPEFLKNMENGQDLD